MPYGILKCDNITFDQGGADQNVTVSGIYRAITSGVTVTGTISGVTIIGTTTVSGATVTGTTVQGTTVQGVSGTFTSLTGTTTTGTTANFASGVFTTRVSGATITGTTAQFTSGTFVSLTGTTITGTTISGTTVSSTTGTFTSITGTTITGTTVNGTTVNSITGNFTSLTGITVTGTTVNFTSGIFTTQISGLTVTGTQSSFTSGNFVTLSGATATFTSGVIASGTAAAPSLSILGDPNTGIWSPAADTVAASTAGTERLRITSAGLVGIGNTAPDTLLTVSQSAPTDGILAKLVNPANASGSEAGIRLQHNNSTQLQCDLVTFRSGANAGVDFNIKLSDGTGTPQTRFTILEGGNVGMGTTSPGSALEINAAAATSPFIAKINTAEAARIDSSGRLLVGTSSSVALLGYNSGAQFAASTGTVSFIRNTADTGAPELVSAKSRGSSGTPLIVSNGDGLCLHRYAGYDGAAYIEAARISATVDGTPGVNDMPGRLMFSTTADGAASPTERMRIDNAGRIGIGTTAVRDLLHLYGAGQTTANIADSGTRGGFLRVSQSGSSAGTGGGILFASEQGDTANSVGFAAIKGLLTDGTNNTVGALAFSVRNASSATSLQEAFRIDSSGRLLVGTSSARLFSNATVTPRLQVEGLDVSQASFGLARNSANTGGPVIAFGKSRGAVTGSMTAVIAQDDLGRIQFQGADGTQLQSAAEILCGVDGTPGASDMPGRLVFSTTADGASSPTERMRIDSAGRVGIGTAAPGDILSLTGGNIALQSTGGAGAGDRPTERRLLRSDIGSTNGLAAIGMNGAGTNGFLGEIKFYTGSADLFNTTLAERARIDSSGRLLVGTSSARNNYYSSITPGGIQNEVGSLTLFQNSNNTSGSAVFFGKSRGGTANSNTVVQAGDQLGVVVFMGADGTNVWPGAQITGEVDGTPGANDMPGRLVFSTTADGAATPTERLRITNDGVQAYNQPAPAAVNATATLTVANLKAGIITSTSAAATDMTLPTGTDTQAGFSSTYDNMTFEWSVINTGPSLVRVLAGTAHTVVGSGSVATGTSGRFASRRTAANTFVTYRLS